MSMTHLQSSCSYIPDAIRVNLGVLHKRKENTPGGKSYWVDACRRIGLDEDDYGLFYANDNTAAAGGGGGTGADRRAEEGQP